MARRCTVVLPVADAGPGTLTTLEAVAAVDDFDFDVVVVDVAPDPADTADLLAALEGDVTIVRDEPVDPYVTGDVVVNLPVAAGLRPGWLAAAVAPFDDPDVDAVVPLPPEATADPALHRRRIVAFGEVPCSATRAELLEDPERVVVAPDWVVDGVPLPPAPPDRWSVLILGGSGEIPDLVARAMTCDATRDATAGVAVHVDGVCSGDEALAPLRAAGAAAYGSETGMRGMWADPAARLGLRPGVAILAAGAERIESLPGADAASVGLAAAFGPNDLGPARADVPVAAGAAAGDHTSVVVYVEHGWGDARTNVETAVAQNRDGEVIVVGDPAAVDPLRSIQRNRVSVVAVPDAGPTSAVAAGIAESTGAVVVILSSATRVARRGLDGLRSALDADPGVVAAGPRSNGLPAPQYLDAGYHSVKDFARFAEERRRRERGSCTGADTLAPWGIAVRRSAITAMGSIPPDALESGGFVGRIAAVGPMACAEEVVVHHDGRGRKADGDRPIAPPAAWVPGSAGTDDAATPLLSACLIVKDEQELLPECLLSLAGLVDEVVVADTGSSDATVALARAAGARVVEIDWRDDFAWARNHAIEAARGRWVISVDADERVRVGDVASLRDQLAMGRFDSAQVWFENQQNDGSVEDTSSEHRVVRIFRRDLYRYEGRLHERPMPVDAAHSPIVVLADEVSFLHVGYVGKFVQEREKAARNERIARAAYEAGEDEPWIRAHNMARSSTTPADQVRHYRECLALGAPDAVAVQAHNGLSGALASLGDIDGSLSAALDAVGVDDRDAEALVNVGTRLNDLGRHDEAVTYLEPLVHGEASKTSFVFDRTHQRITGPLQLARALDHLGRVEDATDILETVAGRDPAGFDNWNGLFVGLRRTRPDAWVEAAITAARPAPVRALAGARSLPAADALTVVDALHAAGLVDHGAAVVALPAAAEVGDDVAMKRWLDRVAAAPAEVGAKIAARLEADGAPVALDVWERLGDSPDAVLGRSRCLVAAGRSEDAAAVLATAGHAIRSGADCLFAAALAIETGHPEHAGPLLERAADDPAAPAADVLALADLVGGDVPRRVRSRLSLTV